MRGKRKKVGLAVPCGPSTKPRKIGAQRSARPTNEFHEDAPPYEVGTSRRDVLGPPGGPSLPFKFIDLFCGIGGFRIAFERAGCKCVWSCDWDRQAQITHEANFGERPLPITSEIIFGIIAKLTRQSAVR